MSKRKWFILRFLGLAVMALASSACPQALAQAVLPTWPPLAVAELKDYCRQKGHMPSNNEEIDQVLIKIYTKLQGNPPDAATQPTTNGSWRVLGNVKISLDGIARNAPLAAWRKDPPQNWNALGSMTLVVVTDGQKDCFAWVSALEGTPLRDGNNEAIIVGGRCEPPL